MTASGGADDDAIAGLLGAARIPASKLGPSRAARLSTAERRFYVWILEHWATWGRPEARRVEEAARRLGLEFELAAHALATRDLVHLNQHGEIAVAYPFSGRPTNHRVRFPGGLEVYAMCAIDALGISSMVAQPIEVVSRDSIDEQEVRALVRPDGSAEWSPSSAVVLVGAADEGVNSHEGCCPVMNFFASRRNAECWLDQNEWAHGRTAGIQEAILAGKAIFGDVLRLQDRRPNL